MRRVYIAGPMSGKPWFNFPNFFRVEGALRQSGWKTINPAAIDLDAWEGDEGEGVTFEMFRDGDFPAPHKDMTTEEQEDKYQAIIDRDLEVINSLRKHRGDAIALLPGWEKSKGANAEAALGIWKGLLVAPWEDLIDGSTEGSEGKEGSSAGEGGA